LLMIDVILDEKAQSHRSIVTDYAACIEPLGGDVVDHDHQNFVLHFPPQKQRGPGLAGVAVRGYPAVLRVLRASVCAVDGGPHKALAIVRS